MTKAELEARREEMCANLEPEIIGCLACHGFDFAAALLQGEIDKYSESMRFYMSELQSANAKLAVAIEKLTSISKNGCCDNCQEAKLVALSALAAMDASEGKVRE